MKAILPALMGVIALCGTSAAQNHPWTDRAQLVLDVTRPLSNDRGDRLPLYLWPAMDPGDLAPGDAERLLTEMDSRGIGVICSWQPGKREKSLASALTVARTQKKLGLPVNINATACLYPFFDGSDSTAHIDADGKPFFDDSFGNHPMGCPFTLDTRRDAIRGQVEYFVNAYVESGIDIDFIWADWEVDGPIEYNRAHEASIRCVRCRENIPDIDDFNTFQRVLREIRSDLQKYAFTEPVLARFPDALVGNYAVYPHDGWRYWYDYFEYYVDGQPAKREQKAFYRQWYDDFPGTGYTFAMPVVYTWARLFGWYDFEDTDYRWFYNMLLVAGNACKSTPSDIPVISFVHRSMINPEQYPAPGLAPMSESAYRELLWHMLLRGTDTFYLWCGAKEYEDEVRPLHEVWAAAQQYGDFLEKGIPVTFDIPSRPGPVVSGLRLGDRVLVRRSDFGSGAAGPVSLTVDGKTLTIPPLQGKCLILPLEL